jgi:C1A family cysteine protease
VTLSVAINIGDSARAEFDAFIQDYQKVYADDAEYNHRFSVFLNNKMKVAQMNRAKPAHSTIKWGVTKFMDLTSEEFKQLLGTNPTHDDSRPQKNLDQYTAALPTSYDWRTASKCVTAVKDQGQCGSCWAFSATEGVESAYCIKTGTLDVLAPQELVSCDNTCDGCNGGDLPPAFRFVESKGLEGEKSYPYTSGTTGKTGTCSYNANLVQATITSWGYATTTKNETAMQVSLVNISPLSVIVDAETWQFYRGGVVDSNCGTNLDHAVQATGYNTNANPPYWIVRNSWGASWGEAGYIYVEMFKNMCGIAMEPCYVEYNK